MKNLYCVLALSFLLLAGCSIPREYPTAGVWYCDELDITLDMSDSTGTYPGPNGQPLPLFVQIDYGTGFFINFCESQFSPEYEDCGMIRADFVYRDHILTLTDRDSGAVYEFKEVTAGD